MTTTFMTILKYDPNISNTMSKSIRNTCTYMIISTVPALSSAVLDVGGRILTHAPSYSTDIVYCIVRQKVNNSSSKIRKLLWSEILDTHRY